MHKLPNIIAIDGPAASGKSTVAKLLAEKLGYFFFDTGIMYRTATLAAMLEKVPILDEEKVTRLVKKSKSMFYHRLRTMAGNVMCY